MGEVDDDLTEGPQPTGTNATVREGGGAPRKDAYLEPGTQVGRYVVTERLGEGGMGTVSCFTFCKVGIELVRRAIR